MVASNGVLNLRRAVRGPDFDEAKVVEVRWLSLTAPLHDRFAQFLLVVVDTNLQ